jgi:hypothetical protein
MTQGTNATKAMESVSSNVTETLIIIIGSYMLSFIVVYAFHKAKVIPKPLIHPMSLLGFLGLAYYGLRG